jgi:hypothetical protein
MTSVMTLRLPDDLKEKCSDSAARMKMTLNKWIIAALEEYFAQKNQEEKDAELEADIREWYDNEFVLTDNTEGNPVPSVGEFEREAAREKLLTSVCPVCGNFTRADAGYCSFVRNRIKNAGSSG